MPEVVGGRRRASSRCAGSTRALLDGRRRSGATSPRCTRPARPAFGCDAARRTAAPRRRATLPGGRRRGLGDVLRAAGGSRRCADQALERGALSREGRAAIERVCERMADLAGPPEDPARLHGDLWSGNVWAARTAARCSSTRRPTAATARSTWRCCGSSARIVAARRSPPTRSVAPLAEGHADRVQLYQLLPLLVHAVLFGGSYGGERRAGGAPLRRRLSRPGLRLDRERAADVGDQVVEAGQADELDQLVVGPAGTQLRPQLVARRSRSSCSSSHSAHEQRLRASNAGSSARRPQSRAASPRRPRAGRTPRRARPTRTPRRSARSCGGSRLALVGGRAGRTTAGSSRSGGSGRAARRGGPASGRALAARASTAPIRRRSACDLLGRAARVARGGRTCDAPVVRFPKASST